MLRPLGWRVLDCPFGRPLWVESAALQAPEQLQFFILCLVQDTQSHMDDEKVEQKKKASPCVPGWTLALVPVSL